MSAKWRHPVPCLWKITPPFNHHKIETIRACYEQLRRTVASVPHVFSCGSSGGRAEDNLLDILCVEVLRKFRPLK